MQVKLHVGDTLLFVWFYIGVTPIITCDQNKENLNCLLWSFIRSEYCHFSVTWIIETWNSQHGPIHTTEKVRREALSKQSATATFASNY